MSGQNRSDNGLDNGLEGLQTLHFFKISESRHRVAMPHQSGIHPCSTVPFFQSSCLWISEELPRVRSGPSWLESTLLVPKQGWAGLRSWKGLQGRPELRPP